MSQQKNKSTSDDQNKVRYKFSFSPLALLLIIGGFASIIAGIYMKSKGLSSSGVSQGRGGQPYGTNSLNGDGIIMCGGLLLFLGLSFSISKIKNKSRK